MQILQEKHPHLECVVVENTPHRECLRIKQDSDILFDHMQGYFGVSSLEGLSQGKPVIAGLDAWNLEHIRTFSGCSQVPWVIARDQQELGKRLGGLLDDPATRKDCGFEGRRFMESFWNESRVLEHLFNIYEGL
jgi:glycosyltransferase involved in cell wall biosynthesis